MQFRQLFIPAEGRSNYTKDSPSNIETGNVIYSGGGGGGVDYSGDIKKLYETDEEHTTKIDALRTDVGTKLDPADQSGSLYARVKAVEGHQTGAEEKVEALQRAVMYNSTFYTDASKTDPTKVVSRNENKGALQNLQDNYFNSSQANGLTSLPVFIRRSADAHNTIQAHIVDLTESNKIVSKVKITFEDEQYKYVYEFDVDGYATEVSKSVIDIPTGDLQEIKNLRADLGNRNENESNAFTLIRENNTNISSNLAKIQALEGRYLIFDITSPSTNKVSYEAYNSLKTAGTPFSVYVKKDGTLWPTISVSPSENSLFIGFICVEIEGGIKKDYEYVYRFLSTGVPEPHPIRREVHSNSGGGGGSQAEIDALRADLGTKADTEDDAFTRISSLEVYNEDLNKKITDYDDKFYGVEELYLRTYPYYKDEIYKNQQVVKYIIERDKARDKTISLYISDERGSDEIFRPIKYKVGTLSTRPQAPAVIASWLRPSDDNTEYYEYTYEFGLDGKANSIQTLKISDRYQTFKTINGEAIPGTGDFQLATTDDVTSLRTDLGEAPPELYGADAFTMIVAHNGAIEDQREKIKRLETNYILFDVASPSTNLGAYGRYEKHITDGTFFSAAIKKDDAIWPVLCVSPFEDSVFVSFIATEVEGGIKKDYEYIYRILHNGNVEPYPVRREVHTNSSAEMQADIDKLRADLGTKTEAQENAFKRIVGLEDYNKMLKDQLFSYDEKFFGLRSLYLISYPLLQQEKSMNSMTVRYVFDNKDGNVKSAPLYIMDSWQDKTCYIPTKYTFGLLSTNLEVKALKVSYIKEEPTQYVEYTYEYGLDGSANRLSTIVIKNKTEQTFKTINGESIQGTGDLQLATKDDLAGLERYDAIFYETGTAQTVVDNNKKAYTAAKTALDNGYSVAVGVRKTSDSKDTFSSISVGYGVNEAIRITYISYQNGNDYAITKDFNAAGGMQSISSHIIGGGGSTPTPVAVENPYFDVVLNRMPTQLGAGDSTPDLINPKVYTSPLDFVIKNPTNAEGLSDTNKYRICLMTYNRKDTTANRWRVPMLSARWNALTGEVTSPKTQMDIAWSDTWWQAAANGYQTQLYGPAPLKNLSQIFNLTTKTNGDKLDVYFSQTKTQTVMTSASASTELTYLHPNKKGTYVFRKNNRSTILFGFALFRFDAGTGWTRCSDIQKIKLHVSANGVIQMTVL